MRRGEIFQIRLLKGREPDVWIWVSILVRRHSHIEQSADCLWITVSEDPMEVFVVVHSIQLTQYFSSSLL